MILHYLLRRLFLLAFVFVALTVFAFSLGYLFPGEVLNNFTGLQNISPADEVVLSQQLGLEQNYLQQYLLFLQRLLDGQWALSFSSQQNVLTEMLLVMPATLELAAYALFLSLFIGIPLGIIAAVRKDKLLDKLISSLALIGFSVPIFWWALLLIMVFSLSLGWLPTSGRLSVLYEIKPDTGFMLLDILLPSIVLATYPTTVMIRFTRDSMLDVLEQNYIKTARAKGLTRLQVLYTHGLRNALLPVTRQVGLQFSTLITLAMITEVIFSWPGIGRWLIDSIYQRNFPAIQGGVLLVSSLVILVNMLTEILHTLFNPLARKF